MTTAGLENEKASVAIRINNESIIGDLVIPPTPKGIVIFAHGSGSSRFSSRNRFVAQSLNTAGFATLLLDLLTAREDHIDQETGDLRFDIPLLAERVTAAVGWARNDPRTRELPIGLFGASTGAAAALLAAAERPDHVAAVVSRGGRADLAGEMLDQVQAPTLLIVGADDSVVIDLNNLAMEHLRCVAQLILVPGATHLFEEPGALEYVCTLASDWFEHHLHHAKSLKPGNGLALAAEAT